MLSAPTAMQLEDQPDPRIRFGDGSPSSVTVPRSGASRPAITRSNVDLPEPFGPMGHDLAAGDIDVDPVEDRQRPPPRIGKANSTAVTRIAPDPPAGRACRSGAGPGTGPGTRHTPGRTSPGTRGSSRRSMRVIARTPVRTSGQAPIPTAPGSPSRAPLSRGPQAPDRETCDVGLDLVPGLAAGRSPQARIAVTVTPAASIGSATCRMASALASRIERSRWRARDPASGRRTRRSAGSQMGERSPARYGRKTTPSAPGGAVAASSSSRSVVTPPPTTLSRNQSSARPRPPSRRRR